MIVWVARKDFLEKNRAAMVDFMEDSLRVVRWYLDPKNHDAAAQIASRVTKQPPERFAGWLFTAKDYSRSPDLMPDLAALQAEYRRPARPRIAEGAARHRKIVDLSLVREAAQRLK